MAKLGLVIIGRNEGKRLTNCLKSVLNETKNYDKTPIIYVDSGSTDDSIERAKSLGVSVISLHNDRPFTAARGRNTGCEWLLKQDPDLTYIQFMDGDCTLIAGWLEKAREMLDHDSKLAIVCGRRREQFPDATPYNRLADMEWNTPVGETKACGGDALMRVEALQQVNGFNDSLICGEEPEMCIRLRRQGWKIWRLDEDMTYHDADMTQFSQWWSRTVRSGWAIAQGMAMYGFAPEKYMVRQSISNWLWGFILPVTALGLAWWTYGLSLILFIGYPLLGWRIYRYRCACGDTHPQSSLYAFFCILGKFPQMMGQLKYWLQQWYSQPATLIEYKKSQLG
ncbi:glycosyl transferase, family 2 [Crocosphaera subtropica ATCC 51142]|uniref:Glycosyl transferase, family 2 n=1 Tax=Crocosphaera subtropica (strain ATCC 51142 / BH68) TaxID=43989 RepID=B1WR56_CROS5|nr:glycosyltransferase [Crocosphaera subtropica]ACB50114.1 glycosyl transferase, family 2 [Crocosphaera subtropica ATCC 51142]